MTTTQPPVFEGVDAPQRLLNVRDRGTPPLRAQ